MPAPTRPMMTKFKVLDPRHPWTLEKAPYRMIGSTIRCPIEIKVDPFMLAFVRCKMFSSHDHRK